MSKIKQKLKQLKDTVVKDAALISTMAAVSKDIFDGLKLYYKDVKEVYPIFLNNYQKINEYLYNDFKIKKYMNKEVEIKLKEEIKMKKYCKKRLGETKPLTFPDHIKNLTKAFDGINYDKKILKWRFLHLILRDYTGALEKLKENANSNQYKDICFNTEFDRYENYKYLINKDLEYIEQS